jgi:hypothetical protein
VPYSDHTGALAPYQVVQEMRRSLELLTGREVEVRSRIE